jgi:putative MATE family efflux protein
VAQTYVQISMTGRMGFDMAMRALVARAVGAGDIDRANHVALQAFSLSGLFCITMALVGAFLTEPLLGVLGVPDSVVAAGADYMRVQFIGMGTNAFRMMSSAALQAAGDTITPMRSTTVTRVVHLVLSPMLVFGWLFFPEIGLVGAALGNIVAQGIGAGLNFRALFSGKSRLHLTLRGYRPDFPLLWRIVRMGSPASVTSAERSVSQLLLLSVAAPFGPITLAAYALTRRLENFVMMGARGLGQASGVLVGQNLGAGKPLRARQTVAWGLLFVFLINLSMTAVLYLFPSHVIRIFNTDPEMLAIAVHWVRIASLGYLFLGIGQVFTQSYNTAGDTVVPMLVNLVSIWLVQQPLAHTLPGWGLAEYGIAWAVVASVCIRLVFFTPYYFTDRWLRVRV